MKIIKKIILISLIVSNSLYAELLFDLTAQDYVNSLKNKQISAKYKISDKVIIETNLLKSEKGIFYYSKYDITGFCNLKIKAHIKNWGFNSNIVYQSCTRALSSCKKTKRLLKFIDNNGNSINLEFYVDGFSINGKEFKAKIEREPIALNIMKDKNQIIFNINGQKVHVISNDNFKQLEFISTEIISYKTYNGAYDRLQGMKLYSND